MSTHWVRWHDEYEDPSSPISRRLAVVRNNIVEALHDAHEGPLRVVSLCAGDARDLISALVGHERRLDVHAIAIEADSELAARARISAANQQLSIDVVEADAGETRHLLNRSPFDLIICCGVFGNISLEDIERTTQDFAELTVIGGEVIWTRHRREPDMTTQIREWFSDADFDEVVFTKVTGTMASVGRHRRNSRVRSRGLHARMFEFTGDGSGANL